nr:MAG TPA: hypothetical protein [Crassvirales sp.]
MIDSDRFIKEKVLIWKYLDMNLNISRLLNS